MRLFSLGHGVEDMHLHLLLLLQFGAFCPLFRLHGQRAGGPPSDPMCGDTGGDNEVWNLARDPAHYQALVAMLMLREVGDGGVPPPPPLPLPPPSPPSTIATRALGTDTLLCKFCETPRPPLPRPHRSEGWWQVSGFFPAQHHSILPCTSSVDVDVFELCMIPGAV
jgi:hypothetical protein